MNESAERTAAIVPAPTPTTLGECEAIIERGLETFVDVGQALLRIRDERLYRDDYGTFEDYCRERWGFRREVADRYVRAAEVVGVVNPNGLPIPASESVARELAPLRDNPDELRDTWAGVVEEHGNRPTAVQVREAVARKANPAPPVQPERKEEPAPVSAVADLPSPRLRKRSSAVVLRNALESLAGICLGFESVDAVSALADAEPGEVREWIASLRDVARAVSAVRKELESATREESAA